MSDSDILKEEMNLLITDLTDAYEKSGKKTTGEWATGLSIAYKSSGNTYTGTLSGYEYLAGRPKGKMPPVESLLKWIKDKGVRPREPKMSQSSLAWAMAKHIAEYGTKETSAYHIYDDVLTVNRMYSIINRLAVINTNRIVNEIKLSFNRLEKNI